MRNITLNFETDIEIEDVSAHVVVEANYIPGAPDVWYMSNGDPGYPGDSAEVEITLISDGEKNIDFDQLSEHNQNKLCNEAMDKGNYQESQSFDFNEPEWDDWG